MIISFFKTWGLTIFIAGLMLWFIIRKIYPNFIAEVKKDPFAEYEHPQAVASIGVLGTFVGITIGLFIFDPSDMDNLKNNLSGLLSGMTSAFVTSIIGIVASLLMKYKQHKIAQEKAVEVKVSADADIKNLIEYLQEENSKTREIQREMITLMQSNNSVLQQTISESVKKMTESIVGDGDFTVIGQMKASRSDTRDYFNSLQSEIKDGNQKTLEAFQSFAKTLAENNTKAFIQALTDTMQDFNEKLTTQFGENFKELNVAVGRMLEWQQNYIKTIEQITAVQQETFTGIDEAQKSLANMEQSSAQMVISAEKLAEMIVTANLYEAKLKEFLQEIGIVGEKAEAMVPKIYDLLENSRSSLENTVKVVTTEIEKCTNVSIDNLNGKAENAIDGVKNTLEEASKNLNTYSITSMNELHSFADAAIKDIEDIKNANKTATEETVKAIKADADSIRTYAENAIVDVKNTLEEASKNLNAYSANNMDTLYSLTDEAINDINRASKTATEETAKAIKADADNIKKYVEKATTEFSDSYKSAFDSMNKLAGLLETDINKFDDHTKDVMKKLNKQVTESINAMEQASRAIVEVSKAQQANIQTTNKETSEAIKTAVESLRKDSVTITRSVSDNMQKLMEENNKALKDSVSNLQKDLHDNLTESLNSLGVAMSQLSKKFVEDYRPLTEKLREVVRLAENIEMRRR